MSRAEVPSSTYRVQLRTPESDPAGRGFTLADAEALVPYLADLGVGALYLSPVLSATPGSTHGYDVVDPTTLAPELGGIDALRSLRSACRAHGLGVVVDIVPNHLGVDDPSANAWWWDALKQGPKSPYFSYFDFDTDPDNGADGKIAIPVLGSPEGVNDLVVVGVVGDGGYNGGDDDDDDDHHHHNNDDDNPTLAPALTYFDHRFPLAPGTGEGTPQEVHDRQHYRLVHWRAPLLGYRRFFTVTGLAGLRQDDPIVFDATHAAVRQWCEEDLIDGIRVDHPDGLADPVGYTRRLRTLVGEDRWLIVEKILAPREVLDPAMPVDGTTGYDALRMIEHLLVDPRGEQKLSELAEQYSTGPGTEEQVHRQSAELKRQIVREDLAPELARLARSVRRDGGTRDVGAVLDNALEDALEDALVELVAATPYYRADYPALRGTLPELLADLHRVHPGLAPALRLIGTALASGDDSSVLASHGSEQAAQVTHKSESSVRLAQVTGAATAKAEEDRLFYRLGRLISLNEVGGSPGRMGLPVEAFHLAMAERAESSPYAMTTLSTHDTKRGEDVRARISVLSQVPDEWAAFVREVFEAHPPPAPDAGYFLLQAVVGVWPADAASGNTVRIRLHDYADKAMREAAMHTTWTDQDADFETALHDWIDSLLGPGAPLVASFVERIAPAGRDNALVAKAVQLLSPGIPDVYQGTEIWEDSLVDPDNRRFVDFGPLATGAVVRAGHPKFSLVREILRLRRKHPIDLVRGAYVPIPVTGPGAADVVAFTRAVNGSPGVGLFAHLRTAVTPAQHLAETVAVLPAGDWKVWPTGARLADRVDLGDLLTETPVVVLVRD